MTPIARLSRRRFLVRAGLTAAGGALGSALLAACRQPGKGSGDGKRLAISNWPLYIDTGSPGEPGTVERFERQTGFDVAYSEDQNDAAAFFAKLRPDLAAGRPVQEDIVVTPYWMAQRLIGLGWVEQLPLGDIANASNLIPVLRKPAWDPQGTHSLPWQSGIAGIAYNIEATGGELRTIDDLFAPRLKGRLGFLTEMRDTIGLLMLAEGEDVTRPTYAAAEGAFRRLEAARADGQIRSFTGNDYQDDLLAGNFAACVAWSGDVAQLAQDEPKLRFMVPASGGVRWADVMVIPRGSRHRETAAAWMNFVYDPENAARIAAAVQYISPVQGVQAVLARTPGREDLATNPLMFPDPGLDQRLHSVGALSPQEEARFDERFARLTQA
jgi:spermidine/putrescine transport system substrate-binding protein